MEEEKTLALILLTLEDLEQKVRKAMAPRPRLLDENTAADYISRSSQFLRLSRSDGAKAKGPDFIRIGGRILYAQEDLDRWIDSLPREKTWIT